jgi:Lon protease-like protein
MSADPSLPADFHGPVRLFPLPNLVLFPGVIQPLHVFEPRYRQLMADALRDDRLIAMALLQPDWEEEYLQRPAIHPVVCVGRIVKEEHLSDGRYNLLLHGLNRARIVEELTTDKLYRTARVRILEDVPLPSPAIERELRQKLTEVLTAWFTSQAAILAQIQKLLGSGMSVGNLCDIFSFTLPVEVEVKQQLLEQIEIERRTQQLLDYLTPRLPDTSASTALHRFPPQFSDN